MLSTIVTSALVASVVNTCLDVWRERRRGLGVTRHEALIAAVTLEGYAINCANVLSDHDIAKSSDGHAGKFMGAVPSLPELKVTAGFLKPKKARVAAQLLAFSQEIEQADQLAIFWWDVVGDFDCARNAITESTAQIGVRSVELAKDLRKIFNLPSRKLIFGGYSVLNCLESSLPKEGGDST